MVGEAAGYGMGLVMTGSGDETAVNDLLSYAKDTSHEKVGDALPWCSFEVNLRLSERVVWHWR